MKNVRAIVRLMSTPISCAASRSCAVDRIARPRRVRLTNSWSAIIRDTDTVITKMLTSPMLTSPIWILAVGGITCGVLIGDGPYRIWMKFWRMNETPIAVISGASRGALRSGRYANRSIATPSRPITTMTIANVVTSRNTAWGTDVAEPSWPSTLVRTNIDANAPTMNTSPWAKLMSSMMP